MEVTVYNNEQILPSYSYNHIIPTSKVTMVSLVSNLLAFAKNLDLKKPAAEEQFKAKIESVNEQQFSILKFFIGQIDLAFSNKYNRKYSSNSLMMAFVILLLAQEHTNDSSKKKLLYFLQ